MVKTRQAQGLVAYKFKIAEVSRRKSQAASALALLMLAQPCKPIAMKSPRVKHDSKQNALESGNPRETLCNDIVQLYEASRLFIVGIIYERCGWG